MKKLIISIDFDGVVVTEVYPGIGELMSGARDNINELYKDHTIIINTCRAGDYERDCKAFLDSNGINYHYLNENSLERISQYNTDTRKISADIYIDDKNLFGFPGWDITKEEIDRKASQVPLIIAIVGESGSGKDKLADYINKKFGVYKIKSYTTRPKRSEDEDTHKFVTQEEFNQQDLIAWTKFGDYEYGASLNDFRDENLYVVDEHGLNLLKRAEIADLVVVKSIRVSCNKTERIKRVGEERVKRDEGMFTKPLVFFDHHWHTDEWKELSAKRPGDYLTLDNLILKWTNRK